MLRQEPAVEFIRVRDLGMDQTPDEQILQYAADHGLIVVSHDVNTMSDAAYERMARRLPMSGLFMIRQRLPVREVIETLVHVWAVSEADEWDGTVTFFPL